MATTIQEYAQALQLALQESKPEDVDVVIENLVGILKDNNELDKYEAVVEEFEKLTLLAGEVTEVEAVFAKEATANKGILDELNSVVGPQIEIRSRVNDELVGGMVLRVDDTLIDASVKGSLERLKKDLSE